MPFPLVALFGLVKVACVVCGAVFCTHKVSEAYNKSQKAKLRNIERKSKADEAKIKAAEENNKQLYSQQDDWKKKYEEQEAKNNQLEKNLESAKNKANDPSLGEDERRQWRLKVVELEDELSKGKSNSKSILDRIKGLGDRINKNNQIINSTGTGSGDLSDRQWIWDVLTLENILIMLAIYAVWKIVRDEQR